MSMPLSSPRQAGPTPFIASLLFIAACATLVACSPDEEVTGYGWPGVSPAVVQRGPEPARPDFDAGAWTGDVTVSSCKSSCPHGACVPGFGCCPPGKGWSDADKKCLATGPGGCDTTTAESAAQCTPGWCQAWRDVANAPCNPGEAGCWLIGRACTDSDSPASRCLAGSVRSPVGVCVLAGSEIEVPIGHELAWESKSPPKLLPPVLPATVAPLSAASAPNWCAAAEADVPEACDVGMKGCAPGEQLMLDGSCEAVGQVAACPAGFVDDGGPPAPGGVAGCKPDANCGADAWGDVQEAPGTLFVDDDASDGGDGSKAKPMNSLADAVNAAAKLTGPALIALAAGEYAGDVELEGNITLRGNCAGGVRVTGVADQTVLDIRGATTVVKVHDLTLEGGEEGIRLTKGAQGTLERVQVTGTTKTAIRVDGAAKLVATSLLIIGDATKGLPAGRGLRMDEGSSAVLNGIRLRGNRDRALYVTDPGTSVTGGQWLIDATMGRWLDGKYGRGIQVGDGAFVLASGISVVGNGTTGVLLDGVAKGSRLTRLRVVNTQAQTSDSGHGEGLIIRDCEQVDIIGADLQGNRTIGLAIEGTGTHATILNARIAGTLERTADGKRGTGVEIDGAVVSFGWLHIVDNRHTGMYVTGEAKVAGLALLVTGTQAEGDGSDGRGLSVSNGASLTLSGARLTDNRDVGLRITGSGSVVQADDLVVDGTRARASDSAYGRGVSISDGGRLVLKGGRLSNNRDEGLHVADPGSSLVASALVIDGTAPRASDDRRGHGLVGRGGAALDLSNVRCSGNHSVGLYLSGVGTTANAGKLLVDGTKGPSALNPKGYGIAVVDKARLTLSSARVHGNEGVGLYASGTETSVTVTDLLADAGQPMQGNGALGVAVAIRNGARLNLRRARLSANRDVALMAEGTVTTVEAVDLLVDGTLPSTADLGGGRAINIESGATLRLRRAWLLDNRDVALYAGDAETVVTASDLWIAATGHRSGGGYGDAVFIEGEATATVAGLRAEDNAGSGAIVYGATLELDGLAMSPGGEPTPEALVAGVQSIDGGKLTLRGTRLNQPYRLGLAVGHATADVDELMIDRPIWVGGAKEIGQEGADAADGIAAHKAYLDVKHTLVFGAARASATQTNAWVSNYRQSVLMGGRYGVVVRSGIPPILEGSVVVGQEDIDATLAMKLDILVDAPKAHGRSGPGSP